MICRKGPPRLSDMQVQRKHHTRRPPGLSNRLKMQCKGCWRTFTTWWFERISVFCLFTTCGNDSHFDHHIFFKLGGQKKVTYILYHWCFCFPCYVSLGQPCNIRVGSNQQEASRLAREALFKLPERMYCLK